MQKTVEFPHVFLDMVVMPVVVQRQAPGIVQTVEIPQLELALGQGCGHARRCATTVAGLDVQKTVDFSAVSVHDKV